MTIFFKNGEHITILGKEGERMKKKIATAVEKGKFGYITLYHEDEAGKVQDLEMVLNLQEVAAVR
jgi:hypothetical protein